MPAPVTPRLTVDLIIEMGSGVVLVERRHPPLGWALPGGFVDVGETLEAAAVREAKEETSLDVTLVSELGAYSEPDRDPRMHTITVVFIAKAQGEPRAADDAAGAGVFRQDTLPDDLAFDHGKILQDYFASRQSCKELRSVNRPISQLRQASCEMVSEPSSRGMPGIDFDALILSSSCAARSGCCFR